MYDAAKIIVGILAFLLVITIPFWFNAATGSPSGPPELVKPVDAKMCVAPTDYMRSSHMDLLNQWRDDVVRGGERYMTGLDGNQYEMSLTNTCMDCHSNKSQFCDRCHSYLSVEPYCWDCHIANPKETK